MEKIKSPIRIELSLGIMFQSVNCYLVPGKVLTLIDCGLDSEENWQTFQKKLNENGYQVADIKQVIITHEHIDHIGLLPRILEKSEATIRIPKMIEGWFSRPTEMKEAYLQFKKKLLSNLGFPKDIEQQAIRFIEEGRSYKKVDDLHRFETFEEGDILHFGNTQWEALNTPGHCPTQFVFLQKKQKRIFSGDMLLPIAPMPIVTEDPNNPDQPIRALKELQLSFERLKKYQIQQVYPGHGLEFTDANSIIEKQQARMQMRKNECYGAIKNGHQTPYEINRAMYPYQMMPPDFSGLYMVLGYLDLLEEEGRIQKETINNTWTYKWRKL